MTGELFGVNKEAEMDHLLKMKKRLEDASVKLKQMLADKEKNSLSDRSVLSPPQGNGGSSSKGGNK
ncbi:hypothetical protein A2U01_0021303 [Trifolium medium]|uniref:Uncharacterized protein n=1 Tax=Trifolium medium TaxID=97028 RepID=A0A392NMG6_9FABA|nr:hypothetical protein [Trifolium medium]